MKTIAVKLIFLLFLSFPLISPAQTRKITGTIVAFKKFPLKNITVTAKKARTQTVTNEMGQFELEVKNKDIIQIKESAFEEYNRRISNSDQELEINLIVKTDEKDMNKAVKQGNISREDLIYGIQKLFYANNIFSQFNDVYQAIKYAVPECRIITENGQRGVQLRGPKTITGSNMALMIVNGVIVDNVDFVTPIDIVKIRRLTTPQAALFGARAANGVITIETR